jgi:1-phosphatidylinositol phosphodiesterase
MVARVALASTVFAVVGVLSACGTDPNDDSDWLAELPDTTSLGALTLPGTHDSAALLEPAPGLAKTQLLTFGEQLSAGVRYFDVRCRNYEDAFLLYHGSIDQDQTFDATLATMYAFLDAHPHEMLIISIKEELAAYGATLAFDQVMANYVAAHPERWYVGASVPALGEVRGKLVLLRRYATATVPFGIAAPPSVWTDDATFEISGTANLRVEDEYVVTDDSLKWAAITSLFGEAHASTDPATLYLAYTSGFQMISALPNIPSVSDVIDPMLDRYFAQPSTTGRFGVVVMDFATAARAHAILAAN